MSRRLRTFARPTLAARRRRVAATCLIAAASLLGALPNSPAGAAVRPLSAKQYSVKPKCSAPEPGHASCLSMGLARRGPHRVTPKVVSPAVISPRNGEVGYRPSDLLKAYELPETPTAQTIALVDAFNDPTAEADLKAYDKEFKLPECTKATECFSQVSQSASKPALPFPKTTAELEAARSGTVAERKLAQAATEWGGEISLDIETAHAICQSCKILLVEAKSTEFKNLEEAEARAEALEADEISNSWGGPEEASPAQDSSGPFNHPGTVITASAGDGGYLNWQEGGEESAQYPSSSPHVVAVGGTRLELGAESKWAREQVWNGFGAGGGGCSAHFEAPEWQRSLADWPEVGCGEARSVSDVSADADPYTGVAVRYTGGECSFEKETAPGVVESIEGWCPIGGTSLASPLIAAVFALAGGSHEVAYPAKTLYEGARDVPAAVHDITEGSNGFCEGFNELTGSSLCSASAEAKASCPSKPGSCMACPRYDGPSGIGTPKGLEAFEPPVTAVAEAPYEPASCALQAPPAPVPSKPQALPAPPPSSVPAAPATPAPTPTIVELTSLGLTNSAVIALNRRPTTAKVAFAFNVNVPARVHVRLTHRVRSHGHTRWISVGRSITVSAAAGRNVKRLPGAKHLLSGAYRLTLTPSSGKPRSIVFHLG